MKPRKTPTSTMVYRLPGGNEDNDLWAERDAAAGTILSTWELDDDERRRIAEGGTVDLVVWGTGHPPVALAIGPSLEERKQHG